MRFLRWIFSRRGDAGGQELNVTKAAAFAQQTLPPVATPAPATTREPVATIEAPAQAVTAKPKPLFTPQLIIPSRRDFRFVALDVETANSHMGSICQIGLAAVDTDGQIETFGTLINPRSAFNPVNVQIHGIGRDMVEGAPIFSDVLAELRPVLTAAPVFQHSTFDSRAIHAACELWDLAPPPIIWHDSVTVARNAWPELKGAGGGHGLANLKTVLNLDFNHHDAIEDARASAQVVLHAERHTGKTFDQLVKGKGTRRRAPSTEDRPKRPSRGPQRIDSTELFNEAVQRAMLQVATEMAADPKRRAVIASKLDSMDRDEAVQRLELLGFTVTSSVSEMTDLVIIGEKEITRYITGQSKNAKLLKADELIESGVPIEIIFEEEFLDMVRHL